jgi:hypothetical protein
MISLYESILSDIDDTISDADKNIDDMYKLHYNYAYLSNLQSLNVKAIKGGMRGIYKRYFNNAVPKLETDRHSILPELHKHPERKHVLSKLDTDGDYIASYMLQCELDKFASEYDFTNESDKQYLEKKITSHMNKILNSDGQKKLQFKVEKYFSGGTKQIITIVMYSTDKNDFKPNIPRYDREIMKFNFTKGEYYYR